MKVQFIYPAFERHAQAHPELLEAVPCDEYLGGPSMGIASLAAVTPNDVQLAYCDDRITPFSLDLEADLYALSFFTPAATRALEIADTLRAAGRPVVAGGIFPTAMPQLVAQHVDAVVIGEGEGVWPQLLHDLQAGQLAPRYQAHVPFDLTQLPPPRVDLYVQAENERLHPDDYPLQTSRGCPLTCDACVVPCVMGKKLRLVPHETVLQSVRDLARYGKRAAVTEDTSFFFFSGARRHFRTFLHELEQDPRPRGEKVSYIGISMPMILSLDPEVLKDISNAGINRFYLVCGFDPITRNAFGTGDRDATAKAIEAIKRCHEFDIEPYTSLLVGNDTDDDGVFDRMLEFTHKANVPKTEFAIFTPYPATPAWQRMEAEGRILDRTWKHYNDANVVFRPKQMSPERLLDGYLYLWREFYKSKTFLASLDHRDRTIQF
ncbi:MAG: B12-binding domain-containing radical SAM protein [Polyangiaceae bacterium]|nr:B12-binding domain-containing radical SAM protein [Polyangiaceae bacterium]